MTAPNPAPRADEVNWGDYVCPVAVGQQERNANVARCLDELRRDGCNEFSVQHGDAFVQASRDDDGTIHVLDCIVRRHGYIIPSTEARP